MYRRAEKLSDLCFRQLQHPNILTRAPQTIVSRRIYTSPSPFPKRASRSATTSRGLQDPQIGSSAGSGNNRVYCSTHAFLMITTIKPTPGLEKSGDFVLTTPSTAYNESLTATPNKLADPSKTFGPELEFFKEPIINPPLHQRTAALLTQPQTSISSHTNPWEASRSAKGSGERSANVRYHGSKGYNIWSAFNPVWGSYRVVKARLPRPSDKEVDWVETVGRPDELRMFLGSRNPVNRS